MPVTYEINLFGVFMCIVAIGWGVAACIKAWRGGSDD